MDSLSFFAIMHSLRTVFFSYRIQLNETEENSFNRILQITYNCSIVGGVISYHWCIRMSRVVVKIENAFFCKIYLLIFHCHQFPIYFRFSTKLV